jgi:hypothetical protein
MRFEKKEKKGNSGFLSLKDGESVKGVYRGEIHEYRVKWENGKYVEVPETDSSRMNRFKLNFITFREGKFIALVHEFGVTIYDQLASIHSEYDLQSTKVKVSRQGSTKDDTVYHVLPLLKEPLSAALLEQIEAMPLNILNASIKMKLPDYPEPNDFGEPPPEDEGPQNLPF